MIDDPLTAPAASDPPFSGELTITWDYEKAELLERISKLEAWASQVGHTLYSARVDIPKRLDTLELDVRDLSHQICDLAAHLAALESRHSLPQPET